MKFLKISFLILLVFLSITLGVLPETKLFTAYGKGDSGSSGGGDSSGNDGGGGGGSSDGGSSDVGSGNQTDGGSGGGSNQNDSGDEGNNNGGGDDGCYGPCGSGPNTLSGYVYTDADQSATYNLGDSGIQNETIQLISPLYSLVSAPGVSSSTNTAAELNSTEASCSGATCSGAIQNLSNKSVAAWVYPTALSSADNIILRNQGNWALSVRSNGQIGFESMVDDCTSSTGPQYYTPAGSVPLNQWTYITATLTSEGNGYNTLRIYQNNNGTPLSTTSFIVTNCGGSPTTFSISSSTSSWTGRIDAVSVRNHVLTPAEIAAQYNSGSGTQVFTPGPDLLAFWKLDEPSNSPTLADTSGNNRNLTAPVSTVRYTGTTDAVGHYSISNISAGTYKVHHDREPLWAGGIRTTPNDILVSFPSASGTFRIARFGTYSPYFTQAIPDAVCIGNIPHIYLDWSSSSLATDYKVLYWDSISATYVDSDILTGGQTEWVFTPPNSLTLGSQYSFVISALNNGNPTAYSDDGLWSHQKYGSYVTYPDCTSGNPPTVTLTLEGPSGSRQNGGLPLQVDQGEEVNLSWSLENVNENSCLASVTTTDGTPTPTAIISVWNGPKGPPPLTGGPVLVPTTTPGTYVFIMNCTTSTTAVTRSSIQLDVLVFPRPYIQTTGGDVHTNETINFAQ